MPHDLHLIALGVLLLAGLALDALGRMTRVPRITLLVLFGMAIGPSGVGLLPVAANAWNELVAGLALTMVAFLLGGELSRKALRAHGRAILAVSLAVTFATLGVIAGGLVALGVDPALALLLGGIGLATDPAATRDVIAQIGARGRLTKTVQGVVAIDDAWGVIAFSVLLGIATAAGSDAVVAGVAHSVFEVLGAVAVGAAIGVPAAFASGRIRPGEPTLAEALGIVLLCAGVSLWLNVSFLIAGMTAGAVIVNLARHHDYAFHEIEHVSWPFLIVFFVLAGAAVEFSAIAEAGLLGLAFILLRIVGRVGGGWIGGRLSGFAGGESARLGLALTPQAGVALGMALVASEAAPAVADEIMAVAIGGMVVFELLGPLATRWALIRAGEAGDSPKDGPAPENRPE